MNKDLKHQVLDSKISGAEHAVYEREVELEALNAEATTEPGSEGYAMRIEEMQKDLDKFKARLKSYKEQKKALS